MRRREVGGRNGCCSFRNPIPEGNEWVDVLRVQEDFVCHSKNMEVLCALQTFQLHRWLNFLLSVAF